MEMNEQNVTFVLPLKTVLLIVAGVAVVWLIFMAKMELFPAIQHYETFRQKLTEKCCPG
jgi:hypothetical protein